jgi:hypothetical protein
MGNRSAIRPRLKELRQAKFRFREGRLSKTKSKLSLEKVRVRRFGLGGQFPDSSTKFTKMTAGAVIFVHFASAYH